jgi:hypothetical protein
MKKPKRNTIIKKEKKRKATPTVIVPSSRKEPLQKTEPAPAKRNTSHASQAGAQAQKVDKWPIADNKLSEKICGLEALKDKGHGFGTKARGDLHDAYRLRNRFNGGERSDALLAEMLAFE